MTASLLDGKIAALAMQQHIKQTVSERLALGLRPPGLAVILVGQDVASSVYVRNKRLACTNVGFQSYAYDLSEQTREHELLALIELLPRRRAHFRKRVLVRGVKRRANRVSAGIRVTCEL